MAETRPDRRAARRGQQVNSASGGRPQQPPQRSGLSDERRSNFLFESWSELKKVEWPGQSQVIQGTIVVLVACIVVGIFLYVNDAVWKRVVAKVFLGQ